MSTIVDIHGGRLRDYSGPSADLLPTREALWHPLDLCREMDLINASAQPASARLAATHRFATALQGPADELSRLTSSFVEDMDEIDGGVNGILEFLSQNPEARRQDDAKDFLDTLIDTVRSARESMEEIGQFAGVVAGLGATSKALRRPGNQMAKAVRQMANSVALMDEWEAASTRLKRSESKPPDGPDSVRTTSPASS
jgi:hypothetical protein